MFFMPYQFGSQMNLLGQCADQWLDGALKMMDMQLKASRGVWMEAGLAAHAALHTPAPLDLCLDGVRLGRRGLERALSYGNEVGGIVGAMQNGMAQALRGAAAGNR